MAHDIGFYGYRHKPPCLKNAEPDEAIPYDEIGYFFGYAQGIFYTAFDATHCDNGVSGANRGVLRSADQVRQGLKRINSSTVVDSYPDPNRIREIVTTLQEYLEAYPTCYILIHYS